MGDTPKVERKTKFFSSILDINIKQKLLEEIIKSSDPISAAMSLERTILKQLITLVESDSESLVDKITKIEFSIKQLILDAENKKTEINEHLEDLKRRKYLARTCEECLTVELLMKQKATIEQSMSLTNVVFFTIPTQAKALNEARKQHEIELEEKISLLTTLKESYDYQLPLCVVL